MVINRCIVMVITILFKGDAVFIRLSISITSISTTNTELYYHE